MISVVLNIRLKEETTRWLFGCFIFQFVHKKNEIKKAGNIRNNADVERTWRIHSHLKYNNLLFRWIKKEFHLPRKWLMTERSQRFNWYLKCVAQLIEKRTTQFWFGYLSVVKCKTAAVVGLFALRHSHLYRKLKRVCTPNGKSWMEMCVCDRVWYSLCAVEKV